MSRVQPLAFRCAFIRVSSLFFIALSFALAATRPGFAGIALTPVDFEPAPNRHDIPSTTVQPVAITYNVAPNPATVTTGTFAVHAAQTGRLQQTLGVAGNSVILTPDTPFFPGETVSVTVTTGILSLGAGIGAMNPSVWQFRTAAAPAPGTFFEDPALSLRLPGTAGVMTDSGDLNGDGLIDIVVSDIQTKTLRVLINDGTRLVETQSLQSQSYSFRMGDLDGDGDLDIYAASLSFTSGSGEPDARDKVFFNDGQGRFTASAQVFPDVNSRALSLGDLDGDGDLDVFLSHFDEDYGSLGDQVLFNVGNGFFTDSGQVLGHANESGIVSELGDLDGDGDLDAVLTKYGGSLTVAAPLRIYINDGGGTFSKSVQAPAAIYAVDVKLADFDDDSFLDIIYTHLSVDQTETSAILWLNDRLGTFIPHSEFVISDTVGCTLAIGDLNGDGTVDLFIGRGNFQQIRGIQPGDLILLNDGAVNFVTNGQILGGTMTGYATVADLDGDGDLDIFAPSYTIPIPGLVKPDVIWINSIVPLNYSAFRLE